MANYRSIIEVEVVKNDRSYRFHLPMGAPLGEAYDAAHEVLQGILEMSKNAADSAKQNQPAAEPVALEPEVVAS